MPAAKKTKSKYHQRADGLLETTRTDKRTGKRIHFYGHSDADIDAQIMAYTTKVERGRRFKEVAEEWHDIHFPTLAHNTLSSYRPAYARAIEEFGDEYIRDLKQRDIQRAINAFSRGGIAKKTASTQLLIYNMIFKHAVQSCDIEYNICSGVTVPKSLPKTYRQAASTEDEERIKASAADIWLFPYFILYTGLRKGEALALTDADFRADKIMISKSVYHKNNRPKIKTAKTAAGMRSVPILSPLRSVLPKDFKGYLFSRDGGESPLTQRQYENLWQKYVKQTGITCTAHELRHSYATMLFEFDVTVKDAQSILGHSTAAMTQDVYTHLRDSRKDKIAKLIDQKLLEAEQPAEQPAQQPAE